MITTRFAPSPTGWIHIGNLRAALFNHAIARKAGGTFILRIDDTDRERSKEDYVQGLKQDLRWLGIDWDREERQSLRLARYDAERARLVASGHIYECFETPGELDLKRKKLLNMGRPPIYDRAALALSDEEKDRLRAERGSHWRFRLDGARVEWEDGILGPVSIDTGSVSDPVIVKNDGQYLYSFASAVDDTDMGITDIVRGADHVTNTAAQIQMIRALGGTVPRFAHHSLLTGPDGAGLSKRHGALSLRDLRAQGVEPMAVVSLMARLGSSEPVELRADMAEVVANFDIGSFGHAPTRFDPAELWPLTAHAIAARDVTQVADALRAAGVPDDIAPAFWDAVRGNLATMADVAPWWAVLSQGGVGVADAADAEMIATALSLLPDPPYGPDAWDEWVAAVKSATGRKGRGLFMPLRRLVTGRDAGPEMAALLPLLQVKPSLGQGGSGRADFGQ